MSERIKRMRTQESVDIQSMPQPLVIPLHSRTSPAISLVGGKARNLALAARAGMPVPPGFVVTTTAFQTALAAIGIAAENFAADRLDAAVLRARIAAAPIPPAVTDEILAAWRAAGGSRAYAVRSSATAEDLPDASFAGQQDTFLNVTGRDAILAAVRNCWASLFTDRAIAYRAKNATPHESAAMAVIVQEMIPADAAGVLFTADPLTGADRIVIEGCVGLADALVGGSIAPERVVLSKADASVIERTDAVGASCLTDDLVSKLAALGRRAQEVFGAPQDVEWAVASGRIWLIQSRPITGSAPLAHRPPQVWTNANTGEVLPDVMTPLTWSLVQRFVHALMGIFFTRLGIELREGDIFGSIAGRAYFNASFVAAYMQAFPRPLRMNPQEVFGGADAPEDVKKAILAPENLPHVRVSRLSLFAHLPGFVLWFATRTRRKADKTLAKLSRRCDELAAQDVPALSGAELIQPMTRLEADILGNADGIAYSATGMSWFGHFRKVCANWLGSKDGSLANKLLSGTGGLDSADAGLDMWRLAAFAHARPQVEAALLVTPGAPDRKALSHVEGGWAFLAQWDAFTARHGHHARAEVDINAPRWSETPGYIADIVRGFLASMGKVDAVADYERRSLERHELIAECRARLRNPLKRAVFKWLLAKTSEGVRYRENVKSEMVRVLASLRPRILEFGERLRRRSVFTRRDDVFFLTFDELIEISRGGASPGIAAKVSERRAEYAFNRTLTPPPVVMEPYDPRAWLTPAAAPDVTTFTGLAVSAGVATGPARVVLRTDEGSTVLPGEILVAPFTDPGWSPYFLTAAGIVMDLGGMLSHGSIVAREYGIPAVVNVGPATRIIKTGQLLRVDGNTGTVTLLSNE